jgi:MacB-like periplasmic core domain
MRNWFSDLRHAVRVLSKSPGFALTSIITLALGIGAVTAVFSVVNSVILQPYAFRDPGQLVVWHETLQEVSNRYPFIPDNYRHYLNLKAHSSKIQDAAIFQDTSFAVTVGISSDYFAAMQIPLVAGEGFGPGERAHPEHAVVSQKLAQAAWPEENPIGRTFRTNGRTYTVSGIAADARIVNLKQSVPVVYLPYWHDPSPNVVFLIRSLAA